MNDHLQTMIDDPDGRQLVQNIHDRKAATMSSYTAIVGLDLSLTSTGIAIHDKCETHTDIWTHRVRSKGTKTDTWAQRGTRLANLADDIIDRIYSNSLVLVEAPSYASVGGSQHDRSGLWWTVYQGLHQKGCTLVPVTPSQRMKYATGKGGGKDAGKDNVLAAAIRRYPDIEITGNDIADAVILLAIGCRLVGSPLEETLPKTHTDALAKLSLPTESSAA